MDIKVTEKQFKFLVSTATGTIFRGGIGSGKTIILCYKALSNALYGRRELVVCTTYTMLRDVILHTMLQCIKNMKIESYLSINKANLTINFVSGGEILLRSANVKNGVALGVDQLRGLTIHDFFIDEARNFLTNDVFNILIGRLRGGDDCRWYITTTPAGKNWVWELEQRKDVNTIVQKTSENIFLSKQYLEMLKSNFTEAFYRQEVEAEIVDMQGNFFNVNNFKVVDNVNVKIKRLVRAWDLAFTTENNSDYTACALCGIGEDNNFYILDIKNLKLEYKDIKEIAISTIITDGGNVLQLIESVAAQRMFIQELRLDNRLRTIGIVEYKNTKNKIVNALGWATRVVYLQRGAWNKDFIEQCIAFKTDLTHAHDDMIDAVSMCYNYLYKQGEVQAVRIKY